MAWVVEADGVNDSMTSATLGDLTALKIRVVSEHVTWTSTGYLWSQAGATATQREFGLYIAGGNYIAYAKGSQNTMGSVATYPIADVTVDLTVDYVLETALFIVDGVEVFNGAITIGTQRVEGELFRAFARNGGYYAPAGSRIGNTKVYIDDVLVRDYDFDGSSHGSGTVTVDELELVSDWTGVGMPTDGSAWVDLGGGAISITGTTPNYSLSAISAAIDLTGSIDITGATPNFSLSAISGTIDLTGEIIVTGSTPNYIYAALGGSIDLTGEIIVTGATASYNYQAINGLVDLTGIISVIGATPNYNYTSIAGSVDLVEMLTVIGQTPNYNYAGVPGSVVLTGEISITGQTPNYSFSAIKGLVIFGETQVIGSVTASFADSGITTSFKQDDISVKYKINTITVNFKD